MITTKSARVAILQATNSGWESREAIGGGQGSRSNLGQVLHGLDCGRVLAALEQCAPAEFDWLLCAYASHGYPGRDQAARRCQARLFQEYTLQRPARAQLERVLRMSQAVMDDYARQLLGGEGAQPGWYVQVVGFAASNWGTWLRAKQEMQSIIDVWDRRGLGRVKAAIEPVEELVE